MPCYDLICPACKVRSERFARSQEREALRCETCGGALETHPDQFANVGIGSGYKRQERASRTMAFQAEGVDEVRKDCPSMDFKIQDGEAVPVFHSDAHHRKCLKEMNAAGSRYRDQAKAAREAKRPKVNKTKKVKEWLSKLQASRR